MRFASVSGCVEGTPDQFQKTVVVCPSQQTTPLQQTTVVQATSVVQSIPGTNPASIAPTTTFASTTGPAGAGDHFKLYVIGISEMGRKEGKVIVVFLSQPISVIAVILLGSIGAGVFLYLRKKRAAAASSSMAFKTDSSIDAEAIDDDVF